MRLHGPGVPREEPREDFPPSLGRRSSAPATRSGGLGQAASALLVHRCASHTHGGFPASKSPSAPFVMVASGAM